MLDNSKRHGSSAGEAQQGVASLRADRQKALRRTGIEPLGNLLWGSHICVFYESAADLIDIHSRYLRAGIADGESCLWALSGPLTRDDAIAGLSREIPDFASHLADGRVEIVEGYDWYSPDNQFSADRIIAAWQAKLATALQRGFSGLRVSGNAFWFETGLWPSFHEYECLLNHSFEGRNILALCTYRLAASRAVDMLNVAEVHNVSITRRNHRWELLETPDDQAVAAPSAASPPPACSSSFHGGDKLTTRERAVLDQLLDGATSKEAARKLRVSPRTIEFHRANLMRKLGAHNMADLFAKVLRRT